MNPPASVPDSALLAGVDVRRVCCFQGDLTLLGTLSINGYPLLHRRSLPRKHNSDGSLTVEGIIALSERLAHSFPPA